MLISASFKSLIYGNRLQLVDDAPTYISIDNIDYRLSYIDGRIGNKGAHSNIFCLYIAQETDIEEIGEIPPAKVIKISNENDSYLNGEFVHNPKNDRFFREIEALKTCSRHNVRHVVSIDFDGHIECTLTSRNKKKYYYPFYVMDYADGDLMQFMEENPELGEDDRIELCYQLALGLQELNNLGLYHRDIKPDNVLMFGGEWKLGDLGLIASRQADIDKPREWIGPRGWMSPESMNKFLTEGVTERNFDCSIDNQSDIFQLAKVFWYIMQGNAPIGCVSRADFLCSNEPIYVLLRTMLNHSKKKRTPSIDLVVAELNRILNKMKL